MVYACKNRVGVLYFIDPYRYDQRQFRYYNKYDEVRQTKVNSQSPMIWKHVP